MPVTDPEPERFLPRFHRLHRRRYGHAHPSRQVEIVAVRFRATSPVARPRLEALPRAGRDASAARIAERDVWFDRALATAVYDRDILRPGHRLRGPALIVQMDTTTVVPPGWRGQVDDLGNIVLERS